MLYDKTLRCYACHGFDGQTGSPRLAPMPRSEGVLRHLSAQARDAGHAGIPPADVPRQDLVDVYAYIKSLRSDAPAADSIPLLKSIVDRRTAAKQPTRERIGRHDRVPVPHACFGGRTC